jgi:hypothetical protein
MRIPRCCSFLLLWALAATAIGHAEDGIEVGMTREQVFASFGVPTSRLEADSTTVFLYPQLRLVLKGGAVAEFRWLVAPQYRRARVVHVVTPTAAPVEARKTLAPTLPSKAVVQVQPRPLEQAKRETPSQAAPPRPIARSWLGNGILTMLLVAGVTIACVRRAMKSSAQSFLPRHVSPQGTEQISKEEQLKRDVAAATARVANSQPQNRGEHTTLTRALLRELEWKRFEELVCGYYNATGVKAELTCIGADGGVDVKLYRTGADRPYAYVQCKSWFGRDAGVKLVRELFGVMAADSVTEGIVVTTGDFSDDARAFARGKPLSLIDGAEFLQLFQRLPATAQLNIIRHVTRGDFTTPTCSNCDVKMVLRNAEQSPFWGCPRYPRCRAMLRLRSA